MLCNGNNHKETNGKSLAICLYWPGAVNYAHLPFTTWQNGLNKYILVTTGDARTWNPLVYLVHLCPSLTKRKKKNSSVSLVFGSECAVTDEVSVSVKASPHTPTVAQALKFLQANEIEGSRNFVSLLFMGGGER